MDLRTRIFSDSKEACRSLAADIVAMIKVVNASGRHAVLGLATGSSPLPLYQELIRLHQCGLVSFEKVITFNLDEYLGLPADHPESYRTYMDRALFDHIDISQQNTHVPDGSVEADIVSSVCENYERSIREAGGIDIQLLGIGRTGHIGFNEPGSDKDSRTRRVALDPKTRQDAAAAFGGLEHVPTHAISMGCGTILEARQIALLAWGSGKEKIVSQALNGPVTSEISASFLQQHPRTTWFLDKAAAGRR